MAVEPEEPRAGVGEFPAGDEVISEDEKRLHELGYRQELSRTWSALTNFAISFTIISLLAG